MKRILTLLAAMALCASLVVPAFAGKGKVRIAYVEWDCAVASTNVVRAVLQEKMGYDVEILPVAAAAMWQATASGDVDGFVTAWLPVTHADYLAKMEGKVEDLGPITGGARLGWAVPTYVTIDSIEELNSVKDKFQGRIIGIDPGAGIMRLSEDVIEQYGLDYTLMEGSGATMTAALQSAIKNNEWVAVTGWSPHWMFGKWDLKYLEDPKGVLGGEESIHTIVRTGLKDDMPEVYNFLNNFSYTDTNQLQSIMAWNQDGGTPYENAVRFINENPEQVEGWLK
ncbi:glycine betaine/proline transport system substrate-binding protein [Paucidesulfovibrio gracilis DSM 16080]|uniref:Glycine betaine/proline transport system substrate-binding protein n=1 Tax=Paucidesulfovibrio gracilis DSM 16080 TaxID=1121449 RepID=A0A1T4WAQ0_9BACT|nr:glycine betaine ABC transporter substrate-binding protein [Paucidesulfovibrio gracilis]SKA74025.1 glycine betaine/proline transport system substrate-binding protein [Paucidesulfovibrio gracilis DSM 16080]